MRSWFSPATIRTGIGTSQRVSSPIFDADYRHRIMAQNAAELYGF